MASAGDPGRRQGTPGPLADPQQRPCELVALRVERLDLLRGTVRVAEAAPEVAGHLFPDELDALAGRLERARGEVLADLARTQHDQQSSRLGKAQVGDGVVDVPEEGVEPSRPAFPAGTSHAAAMVESGR